MNYSYTLSKISKTKPFVKIKDYKPKIQSILEILFNLDDIKTSKIFQDNISKIRFDVSFCDDRTIHQINKEYRNKDCATDVITFSLFCDDKNAIVYRKTADLGQIIVSIETANRQKKGTLETEILTLITHGILHLFGFDHSEKKDYDFVVRIQNEVIGKL